MKNQILHQLITRLSRLPGLGPRSGRRLAIFLLKNRERLMAPLVNIMGEAMQKVHPCKQCGYFTEESLCAFCTDPSRHKDVLCVVSGVTDVWAIEKTRSFKGLYHILGGNLSMLEGVGPQHLRIESLMARLKDNPPQEMVLALSSTVEGSATTHFLLQELKKLNLPTKITALARGMPMGGELDFLDEGTLEAAFSGRHVF